MAVRPGIYDGWVQHRRQRPAAHSFRHRISMLLLELGAEDLLGGTPLWSSSRPAPGWLRRADHLPDRPGPLDEAARDACEESCGVRPVGPVWLLTLPRIWGVSFNPVSFYYLYDGHGHLSCVLAEITNIPWGERHVYALGPFEARHGVRPRRQQLGKEFHVSPFMPMDLGYDWSFGEPADELVVHMQNRDGDGKFFDATLSLRWRPLTRRALLGQLFRLPAQAWRVPLLIHAHAGLLKLKGNRFHAHPGKVAGGAP